MACDKMKYENLEIECGKAGRPTTSLDCKYCLDGKTKNRLKRFKWIVDSNDSIIKITTNSGKRITTKSKIKRLAIHTKYFTIVSDNTSKGTIIFNHGENITQDLGAFNIVYLASNPGRVNELEIAVC